MLYGCWYTLRIGFCRCYVSYLLVLDLLDLWVVFDFWFWLLGLRCVSFDLVEFVLGLLLMIKCV